MSHEIRYLNELRTDLVTAAENRDEHPTGGRRWRGSRLAGVLIAATVLAFGAGFLSNRTASPAAADSVVPAIARSFARQMGDSKPTQITYWRTDRKTANRAAGGDIINSHELVYLVALRGHFKDAEAKGPLRLDGHTRAPTGTVLTLVLDARDFQVTDLGVSDQWPSARILGAGHTS